MPITIKRYQNRKLYNTQSKSYITLEGIEELIKQGNDIIVIDNVSGVDITALTLSQIIFELVKNRSGSLPIQLLNSLVQSGGDRIEEIRRNIFNSLGLFHHYDIEIERRINFLIEQGGLTKQAGSQLLEKLVEAGHQLAEARWDVEGKIAEFLRQKQIPDRSDYQELIEKIDTLTKQVDELKLNNDRN